MLAGHSYAFIDRAFMHLKPNHADDETQMLWCP